MRDSVVLAELPAGYDERFPPAGEVSKGGKLFPPAPKLVNAADLRNMKFPEIRYAVPGYVAEGCTLLAGAPKLGKSWLVFDMAIAKATGGTCLGSVKTAEVGDVLMLSLEDNLRRLQSRMDRLLPVSAEWPARLTFATTWPRSHEGGLDRIREWAAGAAAPSLAIIDTLPAFRPPVTGKDNAYQADYNAVRVLTDLAAELGIAIVVVLHTRKARDQVDPFDRVSGTLGLSGAADTALILDRDSNGVTLYGRGRDIPEIETAVQFNKDRCRWSVLGAAAEIHVSDERKVILEALKVIGGPASPITLADATRMSRPNVKQLLFQMSVKGLVQKQGRGMYVHPEFAETA